MKMCGLHKAAAALVIVGALNWGLVGLLKFNLVMTLLGAWPLAERVVYVLVGVSAVMMLMIGKCCVKCEDCGGRGEGGSCCSKPPAAASEQKM